MIRRALLVVSILCVCVLAPADPKRWKSISECDSEWNAWADRAMPHYQTLSRDYEVLKVSYNTLKEENENLKVSLALESTQNKWLGFWSVGILGGVSIGIVILIAKWFRRMRPLSAARKQLIWLVLGAVRITVAALIAVNDYELSKHPVNMVFMVLVYSLPAVLFSGIGFWWFGKAKQQEPTQ